MLEGTEENPGLYPGELSSGGDPGSDNGEVEKRVVSKRFVPGVQSLFQESEPGWNWSLGLRRKRDFPSSVLQLRETMASQPKMGNLVRNVGGEVDTEGLRYET